MINPDAKPIIAFVAASSGTGKTTLLEKVIRNLTDRGYRVAAIKHVHQANLDLPGKDSWRLRQAGALAVALVASDEYLIMEDFKGEEDPLSLAARFPEADLILLEGFKQLKVAKIEVIRGDLGQGISIPADELVAVASDRHDLAAAVPCFPIDDPAPLADWIIRRYLTPEDSSSGGLTHFDQSGRARMVDVTAKPVTAREAVARGEVSVNPATLELIRRGELAKGDVLGVAQVAAISAVKETSRLIPLCHQLLISGTTVDFKLNHYTSRVEIEVKVCLEGRTGAEMEALTGVSVAALTIYDMCKAVDHGITIEHIRLVEKSGGRSGHFRREVR